MLEPHLIVPARRVAEIQRELVQAGCVARFWQHGGRHGTRVRPLAGHAGNGAPRTVPLLPATAAAAERLVHIHEAAADESREALLQLLRGGGSPEPAAETAEEQAADSSGLPPMLTAGLLAGELEVRWLPPTPARLPKPEPDPPAALQVCGLTHSGGAGGERAPVVCEGGERECPASDCCVFVSAARPRGPAAAGHPAPAVRELHLRRALCGHRRVRGWARGHRRPLCLRLGDRATVCRALPAKLPGVRRLRRRRHLGGGAWREARPGQRTGPPRRSRVCVCVC